MRGQSVCPPDAGLRGLIEGAMPDRDAARLTAHLDGCAVCQTRLDRLAGGNGSWVVLGNLAGHDAAESPGTPYPHTVDAERAQMRRSRRVGAVDDEEPIPVAVGPYQVLGRLGRGGMGRVYRGYDPALRRVVAVKVMAAEWAGSAAAKQRFLREARAAAAICHEHVVAVYAVEEGDPLPYLVMQFIAGRSLADRLTQTGAPDLRGIVRIGMQAAAGLAAAHAQGIIHRDVKPANLLLENSVERVKITDFGLARVADDVQVSRSGQFAGTPLYASPEQARGEAVDHRSDLFSLGAVLYELCAGRPAFAAATAMAVLKRVCEDEPPPIHSCNSDIPAWLCGVIAKLLAKEPAARFQSAAEVRDLLEQYLAHLNQPGVAAHPPRVQPPPRQRPRWPWSWMGVMILALAVVGTAGLVAWRAPSPPPAAPGPAFALIPHCGHPTEQGFHTLNDAVAVAPAGATIEIRGDGPFHVLPMTLTKPLRIRAAPGYTPVIRMMPDAWRVTTTLINTTAALTLEGLEIDEHSEPPPGAGPAFITVTDYTGTAEVRATHCLFRKAVGQRFLVDLIGIGHGEFRHCAFLADHPSPWALAVHSMSRAAIVVDGCVFAGQGLSLGRCAAFPPYQVDVRLRRNTWLTSRGMEVPIGLNQFDRGVVPLPDQPVYRVRATENLFVPNHLVFASWKPPRDDRQPRPAAELEAAFLKLIRWHGERNVYHAGSEFLGGTAWWNTPAVATRPRKTLADWTALPNVCEVESVVQPVAFAGGDLSEKRRNGSLAIRDFARAVPHLQDRGADPQCVGPGTAYEAFRLSAAYADWNRAAGFQSETLSPWQRPFAVRNGAAEQRYATLAEACDAAEPGGTIDILSDGPFQVMPVVAKKPIIIRAGRGAHPKIVLSPLAPPFATIMETNFPLVLEGLEFTRRDAVPWTLTHIPPYIVRSNGAPVYIANCRFLMPTDGVAVVATAGAAEFEARNCEFLQTGSVYWMGGVSADAAAGGRITLMNNVAAGNGAGLALWYMNPNRRPISVQLERNTFWTDNPIVFQLHHRPDEAAGPTFRIDGKRNLLRGRESLYRFEQTPIYLGQSHQRRLTVPQIQTLLARLMSWRTMGDLHVGGREGYLAASAFGQKYDFRRVGSSAQDWRRWWDFPAHEPSTAPPTLVGETLLARPGERLADIRPDDFRLKGWDGAASLSPGADVDVVGPGAAYERWKTTPAYAEWRRRSWDKTHGIQ